MELSVGKARQRFYEVLKEGVQVYNEILMEYPSGTIEKVSCVHTHDVCAGSLDNKVGDPFWAGAHPGSYADSGLRGFVKHTLKHIKRSNHVMHTVYGRRRIGANREPKYFKAHASFIPIHAENSDSDDIQVTHFLVFEVIDFRGYRNTD